MKDDLILTVNGRAISGWESIRVTRGIERCPSDFEISMTELFPGESGVNEVVVQPGDACTISLGGDLVITGYVDRYHPSITATEHTIRITGRGKCQDLVDCSAEWPNGQITGSSALQIAKNLAKPYPGLNVTATQEDVCPPIPQFNLILGETAFEIIERICRFRGLLAYDLPDGSLFLTRVGSGSAASGFTEGQNVQEASIEYSMDQRFSEYDSYHQSMQTLGDIGNGGNLYGKAFDVNVPRNRKMAIIAEAGGEGQDVCILRGQWEAARRAGRADQLMLTTDGWRDSAGVLWTPNTLVPLSLPSLKLPNASWIISEVTYRRDENGTAADLVMMPADAFLPQPILLQPFPADVAEAMRNSKH